MTVTAAGVWTGAPGSRTFTPGPAPIEVGATVRVMYRGYGATLALCGAVGTVTALAKTRATVTFAGGESKAIGGCVLGILTEAGADQAAALALSVAATL